MHRAVQFEIERAHGGSMARAGIIHTPHGDIETPAFAAVGTKATVKGIPPEMLRDLSLQVLIANGYHLYLNGLEAIEAAGGVAAFMGWNGPTMTDSGGFQVFSLGAGFGKKISKFEAEDANSESGTVLYDEDLAASHGKLAIIDEDGVTFTSHLDGSLHRFTPERSIEIQHTLGADIIFAFDECAAPNAGYEYQKEAMERTHRWAVRSLAAHRNEQVRRLRLSSGASKQGIYGIVQGGRYEDLRIESARTLASMEFDGYGIGGSFSKEDILGILGKVTASLPEDKPRHLLGIGEPEDLFIGVAAGMDTFDCVLPTRNGRTGTVYTAEGKINIENVRFAADFGPIDSACSCFVCRNHTRAYIRHLFRNKETLALILASAHNLHFLAQLTANIRASIMENVFDAFYKSFISTYKSGAKNNS